MLNVLFNYISARLVARAAQRPVSRIMRAYLNRIPPFQRGFRCFKDVQPPHSLIPRTDQPVALRKMGTVLAVQDHLASDNSLWSNLYSVMVSSWAYRLAPEKRTPKPLRGVCCSRPEAKG